jgi:hypothetical protein
MTESGPRSQHAAEWRAVAGCDVSRMHDKAIVNMDDFQAT